MLNYRQRKGVYMHRHLTDPKHLALLLPMFSRGEFIIAHGRGKGNEVYDGKIEGVEVPNLTLQQVRIHSEQVYTKVIGGDADFDVNKWERTQLLSGKCDLAYDWFYQQPHRARLKLESSSDRCWLCSDTDPINLALFRTMLMTMFLEEAKRKESFLKRLRRRVFARPL